MPVFLENFPKKLLVSTRCDLGDMVECVLTVMATLLGSRDVRPPFFDDNLHVPMMFYSSPSPRSILLCVMCTYQLKPRSPHPDPRWEYVGNFYGIWRHGRPVGMGDFSEIALHIDRSRGARWGFFSSLVYSWQFLHVITGILMIVPQCSAVLNFHCMWQPQLQDWVVSVSMCWLLRRRGLTGQWFRLSCNLAPWCIPVSWIYHIYVLIWYYIWLLL